MFNAALIHRRGRMLRITALIAAIITLAACGRAYGPQFQPDLTKPDAGRARLYVYRPDTVIGSANADVSLMHLDGRRLTRMRIGGSVVVPISPGQHHLRTTQSLLGGDTGRVLGETTFTTAPGSTIYFRYTEGFKSVTATVLPKGGAVFEGSGDFRFEQVPEPEALSELAKTKPLELETQ
jgi:predicted small lipoprotein YifL